MPSAKGRVGEPPNHHGEDGTDDRDQYGGSYADGHQHDPADHMLDDDKAMVRKALPRAQPMSELGGGEVGYRLKRPHR